MTDDLLTTAGFCRAVLFTLQLIEGAILWGGVPCNSFGFMSSSVHCRTATQPMGDVRSNWVKMSNAIATRFALLAALAMSRRVAWCVENPARSMLVHYPYLCLSSAVIQGDICLPIVSWRTQKKTTNFSVSRPGYLLKIGKLMCPWENTIAHWYLWLALGSFSPSEPIQVVHV